MTTNILMTGVGGQGVVLASDALAEIAVKGGYDVKKSDSLGMSQRGGSVVSHLRFGHQIHSPVIKKGEVDFLLAFERLEGARWAGYLKQGGIAIINDHAIPPLSTMGGAYGYPTVEETVAILKERTDQIHLIPATSLANQLGNPQVLNVLLVGFLSSFLAIEEKSYVEDLSQRVPAKFLDLNLDAFARGREEARTRQAKDHDREA